MKIPSELSVALSGYWGEVGQRWLENLADVVTAAEERWRIAIGDPFAPGGYTSWVAPATSADGQELVYKCVIPHDEAIGEAKALAAYDGDGAVRLVQSEPDSFELLLERCRPGRDLWTGTSDRDRLETATHLAQRLWRPVGNSTLMSLRTIGPRWADVTERRLITHDLPWGSAPLERGAELLRKLPFDDHDPVLLHGDLHPGNILASEREPWLVIDPKPMTGEAAYDMAQLLTQRQGRVSEPPPLGEIEERLAMLSGLVCLGQERVALWSLARTSEWSMWSFERGAMIDAAIEYSWTRSLDTIIGN